MNKFNHPSTKIWQYLALPITFLFAILASTRRLLYRIGVKKTITASVPVIVVGNITAGGSGKTPLAITLTHYLTQQGFKVGIVTRGYGGSGAQQSIVVTHKTPVSLAGDEAVLLATQTTAIVVVNKNRNQAIQTAIQLGASIIISDDGLQHYAMGRQIEIVILDSMRGVGNGWLMPSGILREPISRLSKVDLIVFHQRMGQKTVINKRLSSYLAQNNVYDMVLQASAMVNVATGQKITLDINASPQKFSGKKAYCVAGIGLPESFFAQVAQLGFEVIARPFPDHYAFSEQDFVGMDDYPILMTQKDCVKCYPFAKDNMWYLAVNAKLELAFFEQIIQKINPYSN